MWNGIAGQRSKSTRSQPIGLQRWNAQFVHQGSSCRDKSLRRVSPNKWVISSLVRQILSHLPRYWKQFCRSIKGSHIEMFATKLKQVNKIIRIGTNDLDPFFIKSNVIKGFHSEGVSSLWGVSSPVVSVLDSESDSLGSSPGWAWRCVLKQDASLTLLRLLG